MRWIIAVLSALLLWAAVCRELYGLRRELARLRQRCDRTNTENGGWFCALEDAAADLRGRSDALLDKLSDFQQESDRQQAALLDALAELREQTGGETLARLSHGLDGLRRALPEQTEVLIQLRDGLETLSRETALLAAETPDRDGQMSRAMEEGVNNLLRYAAGKTSGVEVGFG